MVVERLAELLCVEAPSGPGRPSHVTCASGLVERDGRLYVVSDDELALAVFDDPSSPGQWRVLADEPLPQGHDQRKAAKADLEALALLPGDALLVLGSGATARRERGWIWPFEGDDLSPAPEEIALGPLYRELRRELADLNIEGAAAEAETLWLAQRGNGANGVNALIELDLAAFPAPDALRSISRLELGEAGGVRLSFSDLAPLGDGRLAFCCIAEAGESTYHDGECVAAGVGVLDPRGAAVERIELFEDPVKVEGVTPRGGGAMLLVADPDDAAIPSPLLAGVLADP